MTFAFVGQGVGAAYPDVGCASWQMGPKNLNKNEFYQKENNNYYKI